MHFSWKKKEKFFKKIAQYLEDGSNLAEGRISFLEHFLSATENSLPAQKKAIKKSINTTLKRLKEREKEFTPPHVSFYSVAILYELANSGFPFSSSMREEIIEHLLGDDNLNLPILNNGQKYKVSTLFLVFTDFIFQDPDLISLFAKLGANFNDTDNEFNDTPLLFHISNGYNQNAKNIIKLSKQIQGDAVDLDVISKAFGTAALHLVVAKGYRALSSDGSRVEVSCHDVIKTLVKYGANINLQTSDEHGRYTALHLACAQCDFDTIQLLISLGASPDIANDRGELPSDMFELSKVEAKSLIDRTTGGQNIFNQYHNFYGKLPLLDRKELFDKYLMSKLSKDKKRLK